LWLGASWAFSFQPVLPPDLSTCAAFQGQKLGQAINAVTGTRLWALSFFFLRRMFVRPPLKAARERGELFIKRPSVGCTNQWRIVCNEIVKVSHYAILPEEGSADGTGHIARDSSAMPFMTGIEKSRFTQSSVHSLNICTARSPLAASAQTLNPAR